MSPNSNPFVNEKIPTWCPGCGDYNILVSLKDALAKSTGFTPNNTVLVGDIGCGAKMPYYVNSYAFCGLHGRALPSAVGIKLANHTLNVIAIGGDGGIYGEGGNHFIHTIRRNINITLLVSDNKVYALTKGQASPVSEKGFITSSTPNGVVENPFNPILSALASGATFVARGFAVDIPHLTNIIQEALKHKGFSFVDILQPCVTFNNVNTKEWYSERVYKLETEHNYDSKDITWAFNKAQEWGDRIPIGIFYQNIAPTLDEQITTIKTKPLVDQFSSTNDISKILEKYK